MFHFRLVTLYHENNIQLIKFTQHFLFERKGIFYVYKQVSILNNTSTQT